MTTKVTTNSSTLAVNRREIRPFSEQQIALLESFADQAVIAVENARLFSELQARTTELSDSLNQQTALGEVLRVIASSPTDLDRVLQAIIDTAAGLCDATGAALMRLRERDGRLAPRATFGQAHQEQMQTGYSFDNALGAQDQHVADLDHAISTLDAAITTLQGASTGSGGGGTGGTGSGGTTGGGGTGGTGTGGTGTSGSGGSATGSTFRR